MVPDKNTPSDLFMSFIDRDTLVAIGQGVQEAYKQCYDYCSEMYDEQQMHDLLPHFRRATIERNLLHRLKHFKNVRAISNPNSIKNCYHITILGGHASLTISAVKTPIEMVRDARFRKQYAHDNDMILFPEIYEDLKLDNNLYGILLHAPEVMRMDAPGFMVIKFPDPSLNKYLEDSINLKELMISEQVEIIDEPKIGGIKKREKEIL